MRYLSIILLVLLCQSHCAGQVLPWNPVDGYAIRSSSVGDFDGDGINDYGFVSSRNNLGFQIVSGVSGSVLGSIYGGTTGESWGTDMDTGDFDGDGGLDIAFSVHDTSNPRIEIYDLTTLAHKLTIFSATSGPAAFPNSNMGISIELRDMNGDGMDDILALSRLGNSALFFEVFSGGSGGHLFSSTGFPSSLVSFDFGSVYVLDDITGDGVTEVAIFSHLDDNSIDKRGYFSVVDLIDVTVLFTVSGFQWDSEFGRTHKIVHDMNGDSKRDILVSSKNPTNSNNTHLLYVHSGWGGGHLDFRFAPHTVTGSREFQYCGDLDGDGLEDFAVMTSVPQTHPQPPRKNIDVIGSANLTVLDSIVTSSTNFAEDEFFSIVPDIDGDGLRDLLLGEYRTAVDATGQTVLLNELQGASMGVRLPPWAGGNHPTGVDILYVNNSNGNAARRVDLAVGQPMSISMIQDPLEQQPNNFILFGMFGLANASSYMWTPYGVFAIPPRIAFPSLPWLFTVADTFGVDSQALFTPPQAFWQTYAPTGLPFQTTFTLQGATSTAAGDIRITNAVAVRVR